MTAAYDPTTRAALYRALQILETFRSLDADMPMGQAVSLLLIALGETQESGLTVTELSRQGSFALSSASRYVQALAAEGGRKNIPGHQLVASPRDPTDDRRKVLKTTPKGRRTLSKIAFALGV